MSRRGLTLFLAACALQLGVPAAMVLREEATLRGGAELRFRAGPVDPVDPFRGRYVALSLEIERERLPEAPWHRPGRVRGGRAVLADLVIEDGAGTSGAIEWGPEARE
jgi:uncharacterized membrane-anchored protein